MPTAIPDRVPTFDPATQRWHWWSTPGQPSSFKQDQERAEPIEVIWEVYDLPEGRTWIAVTPVLPGFVPFLWSISRGALWLRRPEGVWTVPLPNGVTRKDTVLVQEPCEGLRAGRRYPVQCSMRASVSDWHPDAMDIPITLDDCDRSDLGEDQRLVVDGKPVLISFVSQRHLPDPALSSCYPIIVDAWSRPGPMRFAFRNVHVHDETQTALIITLPNGVHVAHLLGMVKDTNFQPTSWVAVMGDNHRELRYIQPIVTDGDF